MVSVAFTEVDILADIILAGIADTTTDARDTIRIATVTLPGTTRVDTTTPTAPTVMAGSAVRGADTVAARPRDLVANPS